MTPALELSGVTCRFALPDGSSLAALDAVDLQLMPGEILGLVGESGSGKSTLARIAARLHAQETGHVLLDGEDISPLSGARFARDPRRRRLQMVFQDALGSLDPRRTAGGAIAEPVLRMGSRAERGRVGALVEAAARDAGLPPELLGAYPHQLSGGQRARVGIARAVVLGPRVVVLDEPTAALDTVLQAHVVRALLDLRARLGMALLFVSHDLNLLRSIADRLVVLEHGAVVEEGPARQVFSAPVAAATRRLIAAIPRPAPRA